jgi:hypothetical protein
LPTRGTPYGASLSFATTTHLGPPSDTPSREPVGKPVATSRHQATRSIPGRALAFDVGFPLSGSRSGLTPPISTSVPGTPQASPLGARPSRRRALSQEPGRGVNSQPALRGQFSTGLDSPMRGSERMRLWLSGRGVARVEWAAPPCAAGTSRAPTGGEAPAPAPRNDRGTRAETVASISRPCEMTVPRALMMHSRSAWPRWPHF